MADPAPNWNPPPPAPPSGALPQAVPPPPPPPLSAAVHSGSTNTPRRSIPRWVFVVALLVVGLVVAVFTGEVHVFVFSSRPPATTPAEAVPSLGTAAKGHFRGASVTFRYPRAWKPVTDPGWNSVGHPTGLSIIGLDPGSEVAVETFRLDRVLNPADVGSTSRDLEQQIARAVQRSGGTVRSGPNPTTLAGRPAFEVRFSAVSLIHGQVAERMIVTFENSTEYMVACVTPQEHAARIDRGCDQILHTFAIG